MGRHAACDLYRQEADNEVKSKRRIAMRSRELATQVSSLAKGFVLISVSIVWAYSLLDHISAIVS